MRLPEGITIDEPDREAVGAIFDALRPDDLDEYLDTFPDGGRDHFIDHWIKMDHAYVVRRDGVPVLVFGYNVHRFVTYVVAMGTSEADAYPVAMTRAARGLIESIQFDHPRTRVHVGVAATHVRSRRWLERLGFVDTLVRLRRGRGELVLMERR